MAAKRYRALVAVVLAGAFLLGGGASYVVSKTQHKTDETAQRVEVLAQVQVALRASQIATCEASKSPGGVRYIIATNIGEEMARSRHLNYHKLFPNFSARRLHTLIHAGRVQQSQEIDQLLGVDCQSIYPQITSP